MGEGEVEIGRNGDGEKGRSGDEVNGRISHRCFS
jgi:hypothetical protein